VYRLVRFRATNNATNQVVMELQVEDRNIVIKDSYCVKRYYHILLWMAVWGVHHCELSSDEWISDFGHCRLGISEAETHTVPEKWDPGENPNPKIKDKMKKAVAMTAF